MPSFDEFRDALFDQLKTLAQDESAAFGEAVLADGQAFVAKSEADLMRWTAALEAEILTPQDFTWLVQGKRDLAEMEALKQAGLGLARLDRLRTAMLDAVVGTAFNTFL